MDVRLSVIEKRFAQIKKVIAVGGGKGGVGKSMISVGLSLVLSKQKYKVGLFDLDFCGPSAHVILGVSNKLYPKEDRGIIPPSKEGIKFMSITYYSRKHPLPLREIDMSSAFIELLAITRWGRLDFLVIDMPPGTKDVILDTIRFIKDVHFLIVTVSSLVALETVKRTVRLLSELKVPVMGIIENMGEKGIFCSREYINKFNYPFLGVIKFDKYLEQAVGDIDKFMETSFIQDLKTIVESNKMFRLR